MSETRAPELERALAAMQQHFADARKPRTDDEARSRVLDLLEAIEPRVIGEKPIDWLPVVVWALEIVGVALVQTREEP